MKALAQNALDAAVRRGISYADVRVVEDRDRHVSTKNGKAGDVSISSSLGLGVRVLDKGCWGFAATDDLTPDGIEAAASLAVEIARASALANKHDIELAPEDRYIADWVAPCRIDPFSISVDQNLALLLAIDGELRRQPGITLAEASMSFSRTRQVFASSHRKPHRSDPLRHRRRIYRPLLSRTTRSKNAPTRTPSAASIS